jgi:aminopeptidase N
MQNSLRRYGLFLTLIGLIGCATNVIGCATNNEKNKDEAKKAPVDFMKAVSLDQDVAEKRARLVQNVKYELEVTVGKTDETFSGVQKITFALSVAPIEDLPLDFQGGEIRQFILNGQKIDVKRGPLFVLLPKANLLKGENKIEVHYNHEYSHSGVGLHKFSDPEDQNIYLYTNFEPFDANRLAPMFDQPDIKATFKLAVNGPKNWEVIANTNEASTSDDGALRHWEFRETAPISTYLFALVAGPYAKFEGHYKNFKTRLYARKSLAKYVDSKEWLKITAQGLKFYEGYYGIPYPFEKYDQIIVPEFNAGAMENVGAITFAETYLKRGGLTRDDRMRLANVILHEMAHQWFGDLVTMKWWNDLWLNESFAEVMSAIAETSATEYTEGWSEFHADKVAAYRQDQSVTTHAISGVIENTNQAVTNFDDITYGKGASVLKELYFYVGDEKFREALQYYFKEHAYKNTTLTDFIAAFNATLKKDMTSWFTEWLTTTGVDEIAVNFTCSPKSFHVDIKNFSKTPRVHTLRIGRYIWRDGQVVKDGESEFQGRADKEGSLEIMANGEPIACPDMIYPNVDDEAYVKVRLDQKSVDFLKVHLAQMPGALLRQMVWSDLWEMVRDQKLKLADFATMAVENLQTENDPAVLKLIAAHLIGSRRETDLSTVYYYWPRETHAEKEAFSELTKKVSTSIWARLAKEKKNSDNEKLLTDIYLRSVNEDSQTLQLKKLLASMRDQDRRWSVVTALCRIGSPECDMLIERELKSDTSDRAQKEALACRALRPNMSSKKDFLDRLTAEKPDLSADENEFVTENLFPSLQRDVLASFSDEIYSSLNTVWLNKRDETFQDALATGLAPVYCDSAANEKLDAKLHGEGVRWPATIRQPLFERWDEDHRCVEIRKFNR